VLRVLFVPFKQPANDAVSRPDYEYIDKNSAWRNNQRIKQGLLEDANVVGVISLFYTGNFIPILADLGADTQIYIRGHSKPGFGGLFDHQTHDEEGKAITRVTVNQDLQYVLDNPKLFFSLTAAEVAKRLVASGLRDSYQGTIRCYNCHSGESKLGFAYNFAMAMADKGFNSCRIYGYKGMLSSTGHQDNVPDHKNSAQKGLHKESVYEGIPDRAKNRRVPVKEPGQEPHID